MGLSVPLRLRVTKVVRARVLLAVLWLAKSIDPDVTFYVMEGACEIGEVQGPEKGGYAVRLDGPDGSDVVFSVQSLKDILPRAQGYLMSR